MWINETEMLHRKSRPQNLHYNVKS